MAKTLVALYDSFTDAEQVVQELIADGFSRSDIHMALDRTKRPATSHAAIEWDSAYEEANLVETLADLGVPYDEAYSYVEGVRRSGALVVVESSDERAERGMEILRRMHPVNIHERTAQWRQEGWTGYDATAITSTAASSTATTTRSSQEQARSTTRGANRGTRTGRVDSDKEVTIPVVKEDITIGKREIERGHVRIYSRVIERPVEESVRLREEKVTVDRRPVDRPATDADFAAAEKEVIEITETAEEAVVNKRARVVEEVVVQKEVTEHTETVLEGGMTPYFTINFRREVYLREMARTRLRLFALAGWLLYFGVLGLIVGLYGLNCADLTRRVRQVERQTTRTQRTPAHEWTVDATQLAAVEHFHTSPGRWRDKLVRLAGVLPSNVILTSIAVNPTNLATPLDQNRLVLTGRLRAVQGQDPLRGVVQFVSALQRDSVFSSGYESIKLAQSVATTEFPAGTEFVIECR